MTLVVVAFALSGGCPIIAVDTTDVGRGILEEVAPAVALQVQVPTAEGQIRQQKNRMDVGVARLR